MPGLSAGCYVPGTGPDRHLTLTVSLNPPDSSVRFKLSFPFYRWEKKKKEESEMVKFLGLDMLLTF